MKNIILIGMPGCGKTTIGRILSVNLGRPFVDCDDVLVETAGLSIAKIFESEGEKGFRQRETQTLKNICSQSGLVIATGGGCVTREENYSILKQNGTVVFIERDISLLEKKDRPLSTDDMEEMHRQRLPLYRHFADLTVQNKSQVEVAAKKIQKAIQLIQANSKDPAD
jgi:shikimate dehydrogenase